MTQIYIMSVHKDNTNHFQPDVETIDEFIQRFKVQNSAELTKAAADSKKQATLLINHLPVRIITDIQRRLKPKKLSDATYDDIESNLTAAYGLKKSLIGASVNFLTRKQKHDESTESYSKVLNDLASHCDYNNCCLDRMLRDVFVSGLRSSKVIRNLMTECETKKFQECVERAKILEQVTQDLEDINPSARDHATHKIDRAKVNTKQNTERYADQVKTVPNNYVCIRCGTKGKHFANKCSAISKICNSCGKTGHYSKACRSKKKSTDDKSYSQHHSYQLVPEENDQCDYVSMNAVRPTADAETAAVTAQGQSTQLVEAHSSQLVEAHSSVKLRNKYGALYNYCDAEDDAHTDAATVHHTRDQLQHLNRDSGHTGNNSANSFLGEDLN